MTANIIIIIINVSCGGFAKSGKCLRNGYLFQSSFLPEDQVIRLLFIFIIKDVIHC